VRETTIHTEVIFEGKILSLEVLDVELEDGTRSRREVVRHPGAVGVVVEAADGGYVFVRQYRKPLDRYMVEVVAGTLEAGEDGESCARREVEEETGYRVTAIRFLGVIFPTPGYVEEKIQLYAAKAEPVEDSLGQDHDERVEAVLLSAAAFEEKVRSNEIQDAKTLAAWFLYRTDQAEEGRP